MGLNASLSLLSLTLLLVFSTIVTADNITRAFEKYTKFSTMSDLFIKTKLTEPIGKYQTITILAVSNDAISSITNKSDNELKNILMTHVILDYYDELKLNELKEKSIMLTTLYQTTGLGKEMNGFLNCTKSKGRVYFGSGAKGSPLNAEYVTTLYHNPYNLSIIHISRPIVSPGLNLAVYPPPPPHVPLAPAPSPKNAATAPAPSPTDAAMAPAPSLTDAAMAPGPSPMIAATAPSPTNAAMAPGPSPMDAAMVPGPSPTDAAMAPGPSPTDAAMAPGPSPKNAATAPTPSPKNAATAPTPSPAATTPSPSPKNAAAAPAPSPKNAATAPAPGPADEDNTSDTAAPPATETPEVDSPTPTPSDDNEKIEAADKAGKSSSACKAGFSFEVVLLLVFFVRFAGF